MNPVIRPESPSDASAIHAVTKAAFLHAPHTDHTEQFIVDALRKAGVLSVSLVADQGGIVIGHVAISPVSISDGSADWYGLGPIRRHHHMLNKRIKFAHYVRPTRNGEAPLLSAYSRPRFLRMT